MLALDDRDLEAAFDLLRRVIEGRELSHSVIESHLGWSEGDLAAWLARPYEARLADYTRVMRVAVSELGDRGGLGEAGSPDLLDSYYHSAPYRDGGVAASTVYEAGPGTEGESSGQPLRLLDLVYTASLSLVVTGRLSATELIEPMRFYQRLVEDAERQRR